jgi:hypothetical protein
MAAAGLHVRLGARDEEAARFIEPRQPFEIHVAAIHDIESAGLGLQTVEDVDVVRLAVADEDERWDGAAQVEQGVQFDGGLGRAERRPREYRQAQIDRR